MSEQKSKELLHLDNESRNKLKQKQIEIFKRFISICEKYRLTYFVVGGTALGAVRHKGYIPWDDDIDVALPREDYQRFLEVAQEELKENYFLQTHKTDLDYRFDYAKIRDNNSIFMEYSVSKLNINHGIYIDVFPIDGYPENELKAWILEKRKAFIKNYLAKDNVYLDNKMKSKKERILQIAAKLMFRDKTTTDIITELHKQYMKYSYSKSKKVACHGGAWGHKEICEKEQYGRGKIGMFESVEVRLPEKTHEYLTHKYGSYMELPSVDKQVPHHYCIRIDFEKNYSNENI